MSIRGMWTARLVLALALFGRVSSQAAAPAGGAGTANTAASAPCNWSNLCPSSKACCSQYSTCGLGPACLSGCNPLGSAQVGYCAPVPVCQNSNYTFTSMDKITDAATYNGDASKYDWTLEHQDSKSIPIIQNNELLLVLTQQGGGTRLSTTRNVLYGNIQASIKTASAVGVVTAFITMSGVKDEIDWEWTSTNTSEAQTNYYWEGDVNNYQNGGKAMAANRDQQYHTYGVNWQENQLQWLIDGNVVRTLTRASTLDQSSGLYKYPQTPSRIEISLWPAGISSSAQGTIDWAGGLIDWSDPGYVSQGYFAAHVQWVSVTCATPSDLTFQAGNSTSSSSSKRHLAEDLWERQSSVSSFVYGNNNSIGAIQLFGSNAGTIINSDTSTGMNMLVDKKEVKPIGSNSPLPKSCNGNWWCELSTIEKVGIIIGGVVVFLFVLIFFCTCWHRRKNAPHNRKAAMFSNASKPPSKGDFIPLVDKYDHDAPPSRYQAPQTPSAYAPSLGYQNGGVRVASPSHQPQYDNPFNRYDQGYGRPASPATPGSRYGAPQQQHQYGAGSKVHYQGY